MLPEVGELVFSFVVGYMGALEFLYVVRHLYHWGFRHNPEMRDYKSEAESLRKLQDQLKVAIAEAKEREAMGLKAMQDGVMYKDGFRIDEDKKKIEELKEKVRIQEQIAERQREIEEELERQRKIEEETRQQLKKAEEELHRIEEEKKREKQRVEDEKRKAEEARKKAEDDKRKAEEEEIKRKQKQEEEENMKKILEAEKRKEEEQRRVEEEKENQRKILQAEKEREEKQRQLELEAEKAKQEEQERKLLQAEREREEKQRQEEQLRREREENELKLLQAEKEREEMQRQQEIEDEKLVQKLLQAERERERGELEQTAKLLEAERQQEIERQQREEEEEERENTAKLIAAEREAILKQREIEENEENMRNLLKAERELELKKQEMEEEAANLQRLIEAEKQMEEHQRQIDEEALQKLKTAQEEMELKQTYDQNAEAEEEAFIKKEISQADQSVPQTVKTQYGQTVSESLKPKALLFPQVSEESSSAEPASSLQSSFSTQQSSEAVHPDLHFDEYERQAPDGGEDLPSLQYSDDYLRSLDGIKNKPLVREDGSGRRRAFKKRRSSGSSTSSRESRASREEELKMFTSLEEEELETIRKGDSEYDAIKYASEPTLKVSKQHRRHKRSPAKDLKPSDKGSLERLNEEDSNPWGEVKPENYKNTEFWKRERNLSIDEEQEEFDAKQGIQSPSTAAVNIPKMSSFEEATKSQHEEAISALKRQMSKDPEPIQEPTDEDDNMKSDTKNVSKLDAEGRISPAGSNSSHASASASASKSPDALKSPQSKRENSLETDEAARATSPTTGLRRSPRVDEMRKYEESWKSEDRKARGETADQNPEIAIEYASDEEPMSPEHLMEGISDFYDFNASINPRRSRSRSRSKTPALIRSVSLPDRRSPSPLNSSQFPARSKSRSPSPDPASYKFIVQRIIPNLDADQQSKSEPQLLPDHGLSDFYDFHTKLNQDALHGVLVRRSHEVHRTSVDYVLEDLKNEKPSSLGVAIAQNLDELKTSPTTPEYDRSISAEMRDIEKLKEEMISGNFKRSTYVGDSMDFSDEFESLREEAKHFQRSRSCSRSPDRGDVEEMKARILAKQQLQIQILDDIVRSSQNSEDFEEEITKNTVDRNRRASDTALIQKPEILFQIQDLIEETDENFNIIDCEPEEYHHFRRFSLGQEIPTEQYPEDYSYVSEIEIRPLVDLKTLTGDIEVVEEVENLEKEDSPAREEVAEEAYESGSDDERQTVVEVDDEIDEDIWEYNEKPAEESHHEQSECEEADREVDHYVDRNADDWRDIEGAVSGVSDEDSFQIDQIYDEAIKNRKPSGILRDYDCILKEIQITDDDRFDEEMEKDSYANGNNFKSLDQGMWSPRSRSSRGSSRDSASRSFIEYERRDNEMRYLADPTMSAINSTRLRSRYGIVPSTSLPTGFEDDSIDVDLNYKPKREYNWRKNFKLDDDLDESKKDNNTNQYLDTRKFSLGGESITLFSQSPERPEENRINDEEQLQDKIEEEPEEEIEKPSKKKKNRRKSRKGSKGSIGGNEEDSENLAQQMSSIAEGESTKKKHRRESKKTATAEVLPEPTATDETVIEAPKQQEEEMESSQTKKKSRKHRKAKDTKDEIILPKLDIVIPTPEKKAPPPSVAALRAALSAPPPPPPPPPPTSERKPRKLWEVPSTVSEKKSTTTESKAITISNARTSISPQPLSSIAPSSPVNPKQMSLSPSPENSVKLEESKSASSQTVAFTLATHSLTLTKVETTVKSETTEIRATETTNLVSTETIKSELPIPQSVPETSTQIPTVENNSNPAEPHPEITEHKPIQIIVKLDSDILKDGGLYPLF